MPHITLRTLALENEALRLELHIVRADLAVARAPKPAPSVKPDHWTQRPVFYVAFDEDHAFKARAAAARRLNRVVMASPVRVTTQRGTHKLWELR